MKKTLLLLLLGLSVTSLVGCGNNSTDPDPEPEKDPTEIIKLEVLGNMKKEYLYDDSWDFTGLKVNAIQRNEERVELNSSEYTLSTGAKAPKNLTARLTVTAKYNKNKAITGSKTFDDIYVADEVYDEAQEIKDYYADYNKGYTGSKLINELHRHSFVKHTNFVKYGDTQSYMRKGKGFDSPDLIPGIHNTEYFYTGEHSSYNIGTREHVWACNDSSGLWAHGVVDDSDYIGGGADLFHIRPCNDKVNTARGDAPYVDFEDDEFTSIKPVVDFPFEEQGSYKLRCYKKGYKGSGTLEYADLVEPDDAFKGDIARIIAYLYMHYKTNSRTPSAYKTMTGDLDLTKVLGYSTEARCITILKKWNQLDKPSEVEKHRNHVVQQIQGNRNPFVDDYTLVDEMFA